MTDYRILGASVSGPNNYEGYAGKYSTLGLEFYVNQPVYLKFVHLWRNNAKLSGNATFQLYQMSNASSGSPVVGGAGTIPAGSNSGWLTGQANPVLLSPGVRYKITATVYGYWAYTDYDFDYDYQDNWYGGSTKVSGTGRYANGVGNSVIFAPGSAQALSGEQGTFNWQSAGYPNTKDTHTNPWIDITVTDQGFPSPLKLSASGVVGKKSAATATLVLSASGDSRKRAIAGPTAYLNLRGSGRAIASNTLIGVARLTLLGSGQVEHRATVDSVNAVATLNLSASGKVSKIADVNATATLNLSAPTPADFWRRVADGVREALLASNWNDERHHFQESAQNDAEAIGADVMGGLMALSAGDRARAHDTVRHLRTFRVKSQQISGGHYRNPALLQGYRPYGSLGAQSHPSPPAVIDQTNTWLAEIFKGDYGEPIGEDVRSLRAWRQTTITAGPSALYGSQFLNFNRTIWTPNYKIIARPQLATAAWALLAASGSTLLFPRNGLPRPQLDSLVLATQPQPQSGARHLMRFDWHIVDDVTVSAVEVDLEYRTANGIWRNIFERIIEEQAYQFRVENYFRRTISIPDPKVTTQYRVWVRARNALYGEWQCSNVVTIHSSGSAVYPSPTLFPAPTLFPEG